MHIAVKDLVEQGQPLLLGYPQADLDERPTFDLFLILAGFAQGTVAAIEVGKANKNPRWTIALAGSGWRSFVLKRQTLASRSCPTPRLAACQPDFVPPPSRADRKSTRLN